jgi:hypothetical protein
MSDVVAVDLSGYMPIDPIFGGWYRWRATVYRQDGISLKPIVVNLKVAVDRPAGSIRFGQIVIVPMYEFRVLTSMRWKSPTGEIFNLTHDYLKEGDIIEVEDYDGRPLRLIVRRRYNPAGFGVYLTLECDEQVPTGEIVDTNP